MNPPTPPADPGDDRRRNIVHREIVVLFVLAAITVGTFFATRILAAANLRLRQRDAATWFNVSQAGRSVQQPGIEALRRAVILDPAEPRFRLALAAALASLGQDDQAEHELLALRDATPEDPDTNLQLARLEAHRSHVDLGYRYYQNAVTALWRPTEVERRRAARLELADFLLAHGETARALPEILMLASNPPGDVSAQQRIGTLLLRAHEPRRALDVFVRVLSKDPTRAEAHAGAGRAAFELGDYRQARAELRAAPSGDEESADMLEVATTVLTRDPLEPRTSAATRRERTADALTRAAGALDSCRSASPAADTSRLESLRSEAAPLLTQLATLRRRQDDTDLIDNGFETAFRIEQAVTDACGMLPTASDRAILLMGRRHGFDQ